MSTIPQIQWPDDLEAFQYQITFDFITALGLHMKAKKITQKTLARKLGVTEGRVSQVFNNPGNVTLQSMVEWAHALGLKPSVILYDDGDPDYKKPPVFSETFVDLWEIHGKPRDFEEVQAMRNLCLACNNQKNLLSEMRDLGVASLVSLGQEKAQVCSITGHWGVGIHQEKEAKNLVA